MRYRSFVGRLATLALMPVLALSGLTAARADEAKPRLAPAVVQPELLNQESLAVKSSQAAPSPSARAAAPVKQISVLVKLNTKSVVAYKGERAGYDAPVVSAGKVDVTSTSAVRYRGLVQSEISGFEQTATAAIAGARVISRYDLIIGGVGMLVPADQVSALAALPGVEAVYENTLQQPETYRSVAFIGAPVAWAQVGGASGAGEGVIVGVLDSGIWPESAYFSDPDPAGKPYAAVPGTRDCDFSSGANPGPAFSCNNKLIGAYRFQDSYELISGLTPEEFTSARDDDGHGTHTASTAAGNYGATTVVNGQTYTLTGVAPRAHIITYKVCGRTGCYGLDSASAVQQAIANGVDAINFSISGGENPYSDIVELAFLDAYNAGVFVAASGGNSGPGADTVAHRSPWVTTVAASTSDRTFISNATLMGATGTIKLEGVSSTKGIATPAPVVSAADAPYSDALCSTPAPAGTFTGKIVICRRGVVSRVTKGANILAGGAVGMFLYNASPSSRDADRHVLPTIHFDKLQGDQLLAFFAANPAGVTATFTDGAEGPQQGDVVAGFSSRGGSDQNLGVSKPDVTAPGVNILAGFTGLEYGKPVDNFTFLSGTSMSGPHVAGSGALLKSIHPDWTPGQIKSALMTSASTAGLVKEDGTTPFNSFDAGSGRVALNRAWNPGVTFDETGANYLAMQNTLWDTNYPSIFHPTFPGIYSFTRIARNVTDRTIRYRPSISYMGDRTDFSVSASSFTIRPGQTMRITINVDGRNLPQDAVRMAAVTFTASGATSVRIPVTVIRRDTAISLNSTCAPAPATVGDTVACSVTATNNTYSAANIKMRTRVRDTLKVIKSTVTGGTLKDETIAFKGLLQGASPPDVQVALGTTPAGFLPLSTFGVTPITGVGDETISNFNVPAFTYGGESYTRLGIVSNGYVVVGGGTGGDIAYAPNGLPSPQRPNNVLAPLWTDLDPSDATTPGSVSIGSLSDNVSGNGWIVVEWKDVVAYGSAFKNSFQIWIPLSTNTGTGSDVNISYAYAQITLGSLDGVAIGAENFDGSRGGAVFQNSVGETFANIVNGVQVTSSVGTPSEPHTIAFSSKAVEDGRMRVETRLTSDTFGGTLTDRFLSKINEP